MRLLFLQKTTDEQGGSKASLRNTLVALSEFPQLKVELWGEAPGALSEYAESLSIPFRTAPFPRWRNLWDRLRFGATMKRFAQSVGEVDWVISNEMWWAPHAVEVAKHCGAKSAAIVRDEIADLNKARQYAFNQLDRVITVSEDLRAKFSDDTSLHARTRTIYNIVSRPPTDVDGLASLKVRCADYPEVKKWVLSAGTLCPRKDQVLLVKALAEMVRREDRGTGILFVGGSDSSGYEAELKKEVRECGLEKRVLFTGQLSGIGAALDLAAVKVLTSHSEGLPRVLIESALAGVPSISTRVSGVDEVYGSYADRFVLESREPIDLAIKLESVFNQQDTESIERMRGHAEARFSRKAHLDVWREVLDLE